MTKKRIWADAEKELAQRLGRLAEPRNYLVGKPAGRPLQPRNILMFHRRRGRPDLQGGSHQHHRYVLITAIRGGGRIGVDTQTHAIEEGQSLLVLPFQTHWYERLEPGAISWAFVTFEHERDERLERLRDRGAVAGGEAGREGLREVLRCWQEAEQTDCLGVRLGLWLHGLAGKVTSRKRGKSRGSEPARGGEWVAKINRHVFEHREEMLTTEGIARALGVSGSLLRSTFRRQTGKPVGKYVRELKLQYACELLHDTKLQVSEVAERCGYDSLFSFSRAFHHGQGMSPSEYRRRYA